MLILKIGFYFIKIIKIQNPLVLLADRKFYQHQTKLTLQMG
jgi:hypothetical protein